MSTPDNQPSSDLTAMDARQSVARPARPWLRVYFRCAGQYQRVLRNARGDLYVARCAKCGRSVRFAVGQGGTERRFFEVSC